VLDEKYGKASDRKKFKNSTLFRAIAAFAITIFSVGLAYYLFS
jgi:hypothetical protein